MSFFHARGANSAPPNHLAGFKGSQRIGKRGEKGEEGGEKERDGRDGRKHPQINF